MNDKSDNKGKGSRKKITPGRKGRVLEEIIRESHKKPKKVIDTQPPPDSPPGDSKKE